MSTIRREESPYVVVRKGRASISSTNPDTKESKEPALNSAGSFESYILYADLCNGVTYSFYPNVTIQTEQPVLD